MAVIALGADHAGFSLKEELKAWLLARAWEVHDFSTTSEESVDYPDYAAPVAGAVATGLADRGVLVCGTGIGMAMAANKFPGVRAAACPSIESARMSREHNDANVLALGARLLGRHDALEILATWLTSEFTGGRHARRIAKLAAVERLQMLGGSGLVSRRTGEVGAPHAPAR